MRTVMTGMALVAGLALLAGCGSDDGEKPQAHQQHADKSGGGGKKSGEAEGERATHKVTLELRGEGKATKSMYILDGGPYYTSELPWKKEKTVSLTPAEQKVGSLVSVVPGSVQGDDGQLTAASCVIEVDGRQVADNDGGKSDKGCKYKIR